MRKFPRTMSVRVTEVEFQEIKSAAKKLGLNVNGFLRQKVLSE